MIPRRTRVTTPDGQTHVLVESWSRDGLAGAPRHNGLAPRRIRYTFRNLATGEVWMTEDHTAFTVVPENVSA